MPCLCSWYWWIHCWEIHHLQCKYHLFCLIKLKISLRSLPYKAFHRMLRYQHKSFCKMAFIWPPTFVRVLVVECENHEVRYESLATLIGGWNFGVKTYVQTMQKQVFKCRVNLFFLWLLFFFSRFGRKNKKKEIFESFQRISPQKSSTPKIFLCF